MTRDDICGEIERLVSEYQRTHHTATAWRMPLVGFASADDPIFQKLRDVVSPTHALPGQLLSGARTVVAFFIPFDESIQRSNIPGVRASREWAQAYIETNALIEAVGVHMQRVLGTCAHAVEVTPATHNFDPVKLISDWSHRHIAFIAGLGRFGANHMLITKNGCCGRFGSFVTSLSLEPDPRPQTEFCLYRHDASCLRCLQRCPSDALSADCLDRKACYATCLQNEEHFKSLGNADVCGKCLVGVPCAVTNPVPL